MFLNFSLEVVLTGDFIQLIRFFQEAHNILCVTPEDPESFMKNVIWILLIRFIGRQWKKCKESSTFIYSSSFSLEAFWSLSYTRTVQDVDNFWREQKILFTYWGLILLEMWRRYNRSKQVQLRISQWDVRCPCQFVKPVRTWSLWRP